MSPTSPAAFITCRCWETADRVTGRSCASSVAVAGATTNRSRIVTRIGSPSTVIRSLALVATFASYHCHLAAVESRARSGQDRAREMIEDQVGLGGGHVPGGADVLDHEVAQVVR